jgi:hypothetical protein
VTFTPNIPKAGEHEIFLVFTPHSNRATSVPVSVTTIDGTNSITLVNQRTQSVASLGKFKLAAGKSVTVQVSNKDTKGYVVVDGLQIVPEGQKATGTQ